MSDISSKLKEIIEKYPAVLNDDKKLKSIFKDYFPDDKKTQNQLYMVFEDGIVEDMYGCTEIKKFKILGYIRSLADDYGIAEITAKESIMNWADALGIEVENVQVVNGNSNLPIRENDSVDYSNQSMEDYSFEGKTIKFSGSGAKVFPNVIIPPGTYFVSEKGGCCAKFYDNNQEFDYIMNKLVTNEHELIFQTSPDMFWDKPGILEVVGGKNWVLELKPLN